MYLPILQKFFIYMYLIVLKESKCIYSCYRNFSFSWKFEYKISVFTHIRVVFHSLERLKRKSVFTCIKRNFSFPWKIEKENLYLLMLKQLFMLLKYSSYNYKNLCIFLCLFVPLLYSTVWYYSLIKFLNLLY